MSEQSNPLLVGMEVLVDYAAIRPEHIAPAIAELLQTAQTAIDASVDAGLPVTWEDIVTPLDDASEPLWRAWSIVGNLNAVVNTPALRDAYNEMLGPISEFSTSVGLNVGLYNQYRRLRECPEFDQWPHER